MEPLKLSGLVSIRSPHYTLIESCNRHGIEPQAYLTDILKKL
ncbi:MAG: hypothetical protein F7O42_05725, partial [Opitutae bacterium]|nr:hypothetical protein [Opitutae bacterium]